MLVVAAIAIALAGIFYWRAFRGASAAPVASPLGTADRGHRLDRAAPVPTGAQPVERRPATSLAGLPAGSLGFDEHRRRRDRSEPIQSGPGADRKMVGQARSRFRPALAGVRRTGETVGGAWGTVGPDPQRQGYVAFSGHGDCGKAVSPAEHRGDGVVVRRHPQLGRGPVGGGRQGGIGRSYGRRRHKSAR